MPVLLHTTIHHNRQGFDLQNSWTPFPKFPVRSYLYYLTICVKYAKENKCIKGGRRIGRRKGNLPPLSQFCTGIRTITRLHRGLGVSLGISSTNVSTICISNWHERLGRWVRVHIEREPVVKLCEGRVVAKYIGFEMCHIMCTRVHAEVCMFLKLRCMAGQQYCPAVTFELCHDVTTAG